VVIKKETCPEYEATMKGWFAEDKEGLIPLIEARHQANDLLKEDPSEYTRIIFCKARSLRNREKQCSKN
jgi:hypothetical protein